MAALNGRKIIGFEYSVCSLPNTHTKFKASTSSLPRSNFPTSNFGPSYKAFTLPRLRVSCRRNRAVEQCIRVPRISCLLEDSHEEHPETQSSFASKNSPQEATIDLKLPRRSLLVTFTCDACGARSQRLINRLAYERGLVYVQCSGCSQYHKLVDNLGLVVEYNLEAEIESDAASTDQV